MAAKTDEIKQSVHIAAELRESIAANQKGATAELYSQLADTVRSEQILLAQHLQSALSVLQVLVLDQAPELATAISDHVLQRIVEVATRLDEDLAEVAAIAQVTLFQTDIENCETEPEILKDTFTDDNMTSMAELDGKLIANDEIITISKSVAEHATGTAVEPAASSATKLENVLVLEAESQLKDDANETAAVISDQVVSMDNAIVEMNETANEIVSAECVAVSKVETMALDTKVLVPMETCTVTEEKNAINETREKIVDIDKTKEIVIMKTDVALDENINLEASIKEAVSVVTSEDALKYSAKTVKVVETPTLATGNFLCY